jgi:hypothetical protein
LFVTAAIGIVFVCGGIQGYQLFLGNLRATGGLEWWLRGGLIVGGFMLATPGGGIMPIGNAAMELLGLAILVPTLAIAWWSDRSRLLT